MLSLLLWWLFLLLVLRWSLLLWLWLLLPASAILPGAYRISSSRAPPDCADPNTLPPIPPPLLLLLLLLFCQTIYEEEGEGVIVNWLMVIERNDGLCGVCWKVC